MFEESWPLCQECLVPLEEVPVFIFFDEPSRFLIPSLNPYKNIGIKNHDEAFSSFPALQVLFLPTHPASQKKDGL